MYRLAEICENIKMRKLMPYFLYGVCGNRTCELTEGNLSVDMIAAFAMYTKRYKQDFLKIMIALFLKINDLLI